jgi:PTS system cellobiose-specific IIC component
MVISVVVVEVYNFFIKKNIIIKMPEGVPPAISNAFAAMIPGAVIAFGWWLISYICNLDLANGLYQELGAIVPAAFTYASVAISASLHAFLWTLGIHGDMTIGIALQPVWQANLAANVKAVADGLKPAAIYTEQFRSFVVPGGSGATLPLAFYFTRSKSERLRRVGWLGIWPGIFNINEPITFGAPIIFNPVLAIPFIIITFLNASVAYWATAAGLVSPTFIAGPWTLPSPILMFLETGYDWRAIILTCITEFVIPGIIWYGPFKAWEKEVLEREEEHLKKPAAA